MQTYIGCKIVSAEPMTQSEFAYKIRGSVPTPPDQPGYLVEYEDGYKSWSPKDTFERSYRKITEQEIKLVKHITASW